MAITALTVTNPGAETGTTTGWTVAVGSLSSVSSNGVTLPHTGSKMFQTQQTHDATFYQQIDISAYSTAVDAGTAGIRATVYQNNSDGVATSWLSVVAVASDGTTVLGTGTVTAENHFHVWTFRELFYEPLPSGTRFVRLQGNTDGSAISGRCNFDDFYIEISDDYLVDYSKTFVTQLYTLTAINFPTESVRTSQVFGRVALTPGLDIQTTQVYCLVAIKQGAQDHRLRAWTFTQDDHDFYVLQLGNLQTLVYDKLTARWAQWKSPSFTIWRGNDGGNWEGINVCCDSETGIIWTIDDEGRLDYGTTPITSVIVGGLTERFRNYTPVFMAEIAMSEGQPPSGIDASTVGIQLRTSDTLGWTDYGTITGLATGNFVTARFYGLGLIRSPGVVFEITDTGYARRIDGLDIEIGGQSGQ